MSLKKNLHTALAAPMSRREFLAKGAALALVVTGVPAILKTITDGSTPHQFGGYGSSAYGGGAAAPRKRTL